MRITMYDRQGNPVHSLIPPEDRTSARTLWSFLVSNLKQGIQVELDDGTGRIRHASGEKVPIHLYERLMSGARLDELN